MKNQPAMQGSASVLIVLVMLALSSFGVLAMVSSYADLKLARKNADFVSQYYALDSQATEAYAQALANDIGALRVKLSLEGGTQPEQAMLELVIAGLVDNCGWSYSPETNLLTREFSQGSLNLTVQLEPTPDGLVVVRWQEWQDEFVYEDEPSNIWSGAFGSFRGVFG